MINIRSFLISICLTMFLIPLGYAEDLSNYRNFHLGMNLAAVAKQANIEASEARSICLRPALIQELQWQSWSPSSSSPQTDPVKEILFDFYNGELYRIFVSYDRDRTNGLTDEDLIEGIAAKYGTPERPAATISLYSSSHIYSQDEKVLARWEDAQYSLSFIRLSYQSIPAMVILSKRLEQLAQTAMGEAVRLDQQEAPQREIDHQKKLDAEKRDAEQKARPANKANFRP
jgi:hypothetical protein